MAFEVVRRMQRRGSSERGKDTGLQCRNLNESNNKEIEIANLENVY